jgi:hypothetical protein
MQKFNLKRWRDDEYEVRQAADRNTMQAWIEGVRPGVYRFRYHVQGAISRLRIPDAAAPGRRDELWRHTCFEAFVMGADGRYCEFNFSPSSQWAAYRFSSYRRAMSELPLKTMPRIETETMNDGFVLDAIVPLALHKDTVAGRCRVAIAAVLQCTDGRLTYWALAHPGAKPDFHHEDGFIAALPDNGG